MKITFTETESSERSYFEEKLDDHELNFVPSLADVPADTEVLSGFISSCITDDFLAEHPSLRLIATRSTTWDHIELDSCLHRGVAVSAVGSYGDHIVAEHAFALLLALTRRLREAMHMNGGNWFSYEALRGTELHGKTFGILGTGRIGLRTVPIARAFGMKVIAHDIAPRPTEAGRLGFEYVTWQELLRRSQILSLHAPLNGDTFHILDGKAFAACRPGVLIINTARGRLIETAALLEALERGRVAGVGLDVLGEEAALRRRPSQIISDQIIERLHGEDASSHGDRSKQIEKLMLIEQLLARPDVVFTPHIAFNCRESIERINAATVESIHCFLRGSLRRNLATAAGIDEPRIKPADEPCLAANLQVKHPYLENRENR